MSDTVVMLPFDTPRIGFPQYTSYCKMRQTGGMGTPAARLRQARLAAGFATAKDAADALGIKDPGYRHHENGHRSFDYETAKVYARRFKTTPEWLLDGRSRDASISGPRGSRSVVRIRWKDVFKLMRVPGYHTASDQKFQVEELPAGEYVALRIEDGSMDRIAPHGSTIIINKEDKDLIEGKFYIFCASGGIALFRLYHSAPERYSTYSSNPENEPIYPEIDNDQTWEVFGRVYRVVTDL